MRQDIKFLSTIPLAIRNYWMNSVNSFCRTWLRIPGPTTPAVLFNKERCSKVRGYSTLTLTLHQAGAMGTIIEKGQGYEIYCSDTLGSVVPYAPEKKADGQNHGFKDLRDRPHS